MLEMEGKNQKILYLGLDPSRYAYQGELVHFPLIRTVARPFEGVLEKAFEALEIYTHIILTSRTAVSIYVEYASKARVSHLLQEKTYLSVGQATTTALQERGISAIHTAKEECGEGLVQLLESLSLENAHLFYPHSSLSRTLITDYLIKRKIRTTALDLYDTHPCLITLPDLKEFDKIVFTSSSTVHAFFALTNEPPLPEKCLALGPITQQTLNNYFTG